MATLEGITNQLLAHAELGQQVVAAISEIRSSSNGCDRSRCHETMRALVPMLAEKGHGSLPVQTGVVWYDKAYLAQLWIARAKIDGADPSFIEALEEEFTLNPKKGHTPGIVHSWIRKSNITIDFQNRIPSGNTTYYRMLIVGTDEELKGNAFYYPVGREFGLFGRRFVRIGPYVSRLRLDNFK